MAVSQLVDSNRVAGDGRGGRRRKTKRAPHSGPLDAQTESRHGHCCIGATRRTHSRGPGGGGGTGSGGKADALGIPRTLRTPPAPVDELMGSPRGRGEGKITFASQFSLCATTGRACSKRVRQGTLGQQASASPLASLLCDSVGHPGSIAAKLAFMQEVVFLITTSSSVIC